MLVRSSSASAKIILFGEHAVVYGVPAIAVPVPQLRAYVTVQVFQGNFCLVAEDTQENLTLDNADHPLVRAVVMACSAFQVDLPDVFLKLKSDIPMASGLGSGAAVSTALIRYVLGYYALLNDYTKINKLVYDIEKAYHGTPSGIDNTVIVYEKPIYFIKDQKPQILNITKPLYFVIADTGIPASTKTTVASVHSLYEKDTHKTQNILNNINIIVQQAQKAIESGDAPQIGRLMLQNHTELQKLGVSIPQLNHLVQAAITAGAYGAKLSGGGGGGNMIAITSQENQEIISQALIAAGAKQTYLSTLEPQ